ncbi:ABC transporter substrate-binding protein [Streptomyces sp. NPDC050161]|uniref:ABC transporter substrate-binding protein n=1 Tax=Streptomyces sp. NPDC050161 TaxID=3365604 RepID=UPI003788D953
MDRRLAGPRARGTTRRVAVGLGVTALLPLASACGTADPTAKSAAPVQHKDAALHALLPAKIRKSGTLTVATGDDYPPLVSLATDDKTLVGMEPDLMTAVAQVLGLKVTFARTSFDSIIGGVQSHRYDLAIQAMLDKPERRRHITFVDYFRTSSSLLVDERHAKEIGSLGDLCGRQVAVEQGTAQVDDAEAQKKKCAAAGRAAPDILVFPNSVGCFQALSTGRAQVFAGGTPTVAYQAAQSSGRLRQVGRPYRFLPYGILVDKEQGALVKAVQQALQKVIDNGSYGTILKQWKVAAGALRQATVNGGAA